MFARAASDVTYHGCRWTKPRQWIAQRCCPDWALPGHVHLELDACLANERRLEPVLVLCGCVRASSIEPLSRKQQGRCGGELKTYLHYPVLAIYHENFAQFVQVYHDIVTHSTRVWRMARADYSHMLASYRSMPHDFLDSGNGCWLIKLIWCHCICRGPCRCLCFRWKLAAFRRQRHGLKRG